MVKNKCRWYDTSSFSSALCNLLLALQSFCKIKLSKTNSLKINTAIPQQLCKWISKITIFICNSLHPALLKFTRHLKIAETKK